MKEIKKINGSSLAKILAAVYALLSFLFSLVAALSLGLGAISKGAGGAFLAAFFIYTGLGILTGLAASFLAGFCGWIIGHAVAAIYNFLATRFGGIKVELAEEEIKNN